MRAALAQDEPSSPGEQQAEQEREGNPSSNSADFDARVPQLKLLRSMQLAINEQTDRLNARRAQTAGQRRAVAEQLQQLSQRQGRLAELVSELVRQLEATNEPPVQNNTPLPDI